MTVELNPDERAQLSDVEALLSSETPRPITFDMLLDRWSSFVAEVEEGYRSSIDDYTNDLFTRDFLSRVLEAVPPTLAERLGTLVQPVDKRFEQATRKDEGGVIRQFFEPPQSWWWSRLPRKLTETLAATLGAGQ
jgi:hypothetical protein